MAPTPADRSAPQGVDAAGHDALLAAKRGAVLHGLTLLAELGRQDASDVAYLARQDASHALVGVHVWPRAHERGYEFAIVFELDVSLPGPPGICPVCGRAVVGWTRYCSCGADVSGMSQAPTPDDKRERLEKIRRATRDEYEIVGSLAYNAGGGAVYFGRHRERGDIVPLRAYEKEPGGLVTVAAGATLPPIGATSPYSGPVSFSAPPGQPAGAVPPPPPPPAAAPRISGPGSLRLRRQSPPTPGIAVAVPKVCPQCGEEYDTASRFCPRDGSPLRPKDTDDPLVGSVIAGRYHVLKRLGEGGMGRVYLAEHVRMHRQCAIKVMNAELVHDAGAAARFAREASSAARILHPNVAAVFDYGEADGVVYLVMEYVAGEPLSALIEREGRLAPQRALDFARQIADGLAAAHELGIVHRDLKPDNILVARGPAGREVAKVVDFGIAKLTEETAVEGLTRAGFVIGTPEFMSPEQLLGDPVDARSDVYSLGCILFIMLTGRATFVASTREQMIKRRLSEAPPHPMALVPELEGSFDALVVRMLERVPAARFNSAAEVRAALAHTAASNVAAESGPNLPPPYHAAPLSFAGRAGKKAPARSPAAARRRLMARLATVALVLAAVFATGRWKNFRAVNAARTAAADSVAGGRAKSAPARAARVSAAPAPAAKPGDSVAAPPRENPDATQIRAVIDRYRAAVETGDIARVRAAYAAMPATQQQFWSNNVFALADGIHATVDYANQQIAGDSAAADFTMRLRFTYTKGRTPGSITLPYHARLTRDGVSWVLNELRSQ